MAENITVAARLNGGLGSYIVQENFIQCLFDKFHDYLLIDVFADNDDSINTGILKNQYFVRNYYKRDDFDMHNYDLVIDVNFFPKVLSSNLHKIKSVNSELYSLVNTWIKFRDDITTHYFMDSSTLYEPNIFAYALAKGKTKLTLLDLDGNLNIERSYRLKITTNLDEKEVLLKFGLTTKYITIQQGVNARCLTLTSPRQWPNKYYSEFCNLFKKKWPQYKIVQLGQIENNTIIQGVDLSLLGETDFEELKVILKNSTIHIDGDCGMVHLRKSLHTGPSVVLFGQTPAEVIGYDDDINVASNACRHWCAKMYDSWKIKCYLDEPICMLSIKPEKVLDLVTSYLSGNYSISKPVNIKLQQLLAEPSIELDSEWVDNWLIKEQLWGYALETISLRDLKGYMLTETGYILTNIDKMPQYKFLIGDKKTYLDYLKLNDKLNSGHEHSLTRYEKLINDLNKAYNPSMKIVVDYEYRILDGAHRACWLAAKNGIDFKIEILKLYGGW